MTTVVLCLQVVDNRPKGRYDGTAPEPNPKIRSGHMHSSISFPFTNIIDPQTKTMKDPEAIKQGVQVHVVDDEVDMVKLSKVFCSVDMAVFACYYDQ